MSDIEKNINNALNLMNNDFLPNTNENYSYPFSITNENLCDYFPLFPIKDGNVLTVSGSGDHVLQSILEGAKNIKTFDKNIFSLYLTKLKVAAIHSLTHEEYLNFFYNKGEENYFSLKYYSKIRQYLDNDAQKFWDSMYKIENFINQPGLFFIEENPLFNNGNNSFRKEEKYNIMKKNLNNLSISYYHSNLFQLEQYILNNERFDAIFLSNIYDWVKGIYGNKNRFEKFIKQNLAKYLNINGMIAVYVTSSGYFDMRLESRFKNAIQFNKKDKVIVYKNK